MGRIFGTDGARGIANTEISCKLSMNIGRALGMVISEKKKDKVKVVVGKDTRISGSMLESAISAGLCSVGVDVIKVGFVPTPAIAYLIKEMGADAGVMLSASHNSYEYNGIKIFGGDGFKLSDADEFELEAIVLDHALPYDIKWNDEIGRIYEDNDAVNKYIDHIVGTVPQKLDGIKVALDCSNGSASSTAEKMFKKLGVNVTILNDKPDGININDNCGSTHINKLSTFVKENGYDIGFAFDGDADRCLAVDNEGVLVDGDKIVAILSKHLKNNNMLKGNTIVATVMTNMGLLKYAKDNDINVDITKVGDRYVLESMIENGYNIGGEQSGHVIMREYMPTGDGQLTAVQVLNVVKDTGITIKELATIMKVYPQMTINVRADKEMKSRLGTDAGIIMAKEKYEKQLGERGRILLRPSGTEPLIRVMVEGENKDEITDVANDLAQIIKERLENNENCKQVEGI